MPQPVPIQKLHHWAYRCTDAEETRKFYEDLLGLPLVHVIRADKVPSTGEYCPYVHIFFEMQDGSYVAFFDLGDNQKPVHSPNTPEWVNHLALEVESVDAVMAAKKRLADAGVDVVGPTDHGFVTSIYFFDPNGIRLELTARTDESVLLEEDAREKARQACDAWTKEKAARNAAVPA